MFWGSVITVFCQLSLAHSTGALRGSWERKCKSKSGGEHWPLLLMACYHTTLQEPHPCWLTWGAAGSRSGGRKVTVFVSSIRIGVLCAYAANQNLSSQVKNIRRLVNSNMRDLHTFANDTPMVRHEFFHTASRRSIIALSCKAGTCCQCKHDHYIVRQHYR